MRHLAEVVVSWRALAGALALALFCAGPAAAQVAMPDAGQMSGMPLPAPELPNGTVSVRVVRERMGNNIAGQSVSVTSDGQTRTAATDAQGRAEFGGFTPGAIVVATTTVDDEVLVSQELQVPQRGGVRVALVAGAAAAAARERATADAAAQEPAREGVVVLGGESRIIFEFQSDVLTVFYLFDIQNNARTPIDPGGSLDFTLPAGAASPTILQGSTRQATVRGDTVRVAGPFAPGTTSLQVGFSLPDHGGRYTLRQRLPAAYEQAFVAVEKIGDMQVTSPQLPSVRETNAEGGKVFILASGGRLAAGDELVVSLTNVPAQNMVPRWTAVGLAGLIIAVGFYFAFASPRRTERATFESERVRLLRELVAIEERRRTGRPRARDAERRHALTAELERVLAALDEAPEGGQGAAA